eukprot:3571874-Pleurochrysis_carterae.AAC.3
MRRPLYHFVCVRGFTAAAGQRPLGARAPRDQRAAAPPRAHRAAAPDRAQAQGAAAGTRPRDAWPRRGRDTLGAV